MRHRAILWSTALALVVIACGSRGPLDDTAISSVSSDGGLDASVPGADGAPPPGEVDAGHDAGPLACASCVVGTCGDAIVSCISTPSCIGIFSCLTTTCLASGDGGLGGLAGGGLGGIDTACLLGCAGKNPAGALQIIQVFQCVTGTCSGDCGSVLGGLGGGLGGLGGLLGGGGGKKLDRLDDGFERDLDPERAHTPIMSGEAFDRVFSAWPELVTRAR